MGKNSSLQSASPNAFRFGVHNNGSSKPKLTFRSSFTRTASNHPTTHHTPHTTRQSTKPNHDEKQNRWEELWFYWNDLFKTKWTSLSYHFLKLLIKLIIHEYFLTNAFGRYKMWDKIYQI